MTPWINGFGLATVLTALFALRYRYWRSPRVLISYFSFFFVVELGVSHWMLPPGAFGPEVGLVCLAVGALVMAAIYGLHRYENAVGEDS
jgi:hypothetical protein